MLAVTTRFATAAQDSLSELIARVKREVDLRLLVADRLEEARDFGHYIRARCLSPGHTDSTPSAMYYADGCRCTACGWKADAIDLYRMFHPDEEVSIREACEALLAGDCKLIEHSPRQVRRTPRALDPDKATRYHLDLAANPEALARLTGMGFTLPAIKHFRLGWARVLTSLDPKKDAGRFDPEDPELVWREGVPYQWQYRFSVPVYEGGQLAQILYRKSDDSLGGGKIQMERGAGVHLYNADVLSAGDLVVYAEGWGDVIALWQCGIAAVTSTNGAGHWNEGWADQLANVRRLYVVGDADNAGQQMVQRFIKRMPWAREIQLPSGQGRDIRDLYLAGWRRPEFLRLLREADFRAARRVAGA